MGTTITAALVEPDGRVIFGHVGDSRAYLLRDDELEQLTNDHSLVAELVRRGELSPEEAEVHPQRSVITRALGTDPDVDVDTFSVDARAGDLYPDLLATGSRRWSTPATIETIVRSNRADLERAAQRADPGGEPTAAARTTSRRCSSPWKRESQSRAPVGRARRTDARVRAGTRGRGHAPSGGWHRAAPTCTVSGRHDGRPGVRDSGGD